MNSPLDQSVTVLKGIGEETEASLGQMGIFTIYDLLTYFPFRYEDDRLKDLREVRHDERVTVTGRVHSEPSLIYYSKNGHACR